MIKTRLLRVLAAAALFVCLTATAFCAGSDQTLRIGIREGSKSVSIIGTQGAAVYKNGSLWKKVGANKPVKVELKGKDLVVNGSKSKGAVSVRPMKKGVVKLTDGYSYRGSIECMQPSKASGITVVNVVPLEQYLYGVVGKEMSPSWSSEALKAQAVAARTYAVYHKNSFRNKGFDMTDDTRSQVYAGINGESPSIISAVDATKGEILTYKGKPIEAIFCATAGGWTENSENVWGNYVPYLRGVVDRSEKMPSYSWTVTTTPEKLAANLKAAGKNVGKIKSITLSPLGKRPMDVSDRGVSGRVLSMTIQGSSGSVRLTGNAFQSIMGLKSTLFDIYQGAEKKQKDSKKDNKKKSSRKMTFKIKDKKPITIYGFGWGHGLGMSQYGAYQMAQEQKNAKNTYRKILQHYYTGVKLDKID